MDPLGGAGVHYWAAIAERYGLNLTVTNAHVDPTFRFMDVDWDGRIRMDPSSPYAMQSLDRAARIGSTSRSPATPTTTAMASSRKASDCCPPNHYLAACVHYLFSNRPGWTAECGGRARPWCRAA